MLLHTSERMEKNSEREIKLKCKAFISKCNSFPYIYYARFSSFLKLTAYLNCLKHEKIYCAEQAYFGKGVSVDDSVRLSHLSFVLPLLILFSV